MGWIAIQETKYNNKKITEIENPIKILKNLYHYLNLDQETEKLPSEKIWIHDQKILDKAYSFYEDLDKKFKHFNLPWKKLNSFLNSKNPPVNSKLEFGNTSWDVIHTAHKGHQLAMGILRLPIMIAKESGYFKLRGNDFLEVEIPQDILNINLKKKLISELTPTNELNSNEIIASSGGIFYSRENPDAYDFVKEGQHVERGQVLGLLEVMKMFNEIRAPSNGTIIKKCFKNNSGFLVAKKQLLFLIEPDEQQSTFREEQKLINKEKQTSIFMKKISYC